MPLSPGFSGNAEKARKKGFSTRDMVQVALFALLVAVGTFIRLPLPFSPVPITLQTAVVLAAGLMLGANKAAAALLTYLCMGLLGLPVFTGGGGFHSLLLPSFGFIVGFVPAAWLVGRIQEFFAQQGSATGSGLLRSACACLAGILVYDTVGILWLHMNLNYVLANDVPFSKTLALGLLPFLLPDLLKLAAVVSLAAMLARRAQAGNAIPRSH